MLIPTTGCRHFLSLDRSAAGVSSESFLKLCFSLVNEGYPHRFPAYDVGKTLLHHIVLEFFHSELYFTKYGLNFNVSLFGCYKVTFPS